MLRLVAPSSVLFLPLDGAVDGVVGCAVPGGCAAGAWEAMVADASEASSKRNARDGEFWVDDRRGVDADEREGKSESSSICPGSESRGLVAIHLVRAGAPSVFAEREKEGMESATAGSSACAR
jgi:hypothetical protein